MLKMHFLLPTQQCSSKGNSENYGVNPKRGDQEAPVQSRNSWFPSANSSMGQSRQDFDNGRADFQLTSLDSRSRLGEANLPKHDAPRENELSPLGLLWSELEGMHPKQPLSSNVLGVNDRRNSKPTAPKDIPPANIRHGPLSRMNESPVMRDEWPANIGRLDSMNDANISGLMPQVEPELGHLNFEEQMLLTQIRREQLQQEQMMARNNLEFPGQFAEHASLNLNTSSITNSNSFSRSSTASSFSKSSIKGSCSSAKPSYCNSNNSNSSN